jgi:hypothetical protein
MVHYNIQEIVSKTKKHIEYNDGINVEDCFVDKDDNVLYLISGANEQIFWCEEKFVPKRLLDDFFIVSASRSQSEQLQFECRVQKDLVIPCLKKCRTTGVLLTVFNCGIICGYREIFSAESLSQVAIFLLDIAEYGSSLPQYLIYDNACHLDAFLKNRKISEKSDRGKLLSNLTFVIDRFHIKYHTNKK